MKHPTLALALLFLFSCVLPAQQRPPNTLFFDDFESGLERWAISDATAIALFDSGDPSHGKVLRMTPAHSTLHALIRGSERWGGYRIEGEVLFPEKGESYMGLIYHFAEADGRIDLGSIYIKGNGNYLQVNPRFDWNPARMLYEEYKTRLSGPDGIRIGEWQRFAAEVVGRDCHFYVGDMKTPKVTFDGYHRESGQAGFKPRVVGVPAWIDNIRVTAIEALTYRGPRRPDGLHYQPERLVTRWSALGPLTRTHREVEMAPVPTAVSAVENGNPHAWRDFATDPRGAVVTGRVVDFLGSRTVGYFATTILVADNERAELEFSSIDNIAVWVNGMFRGYGNRDTFAWHDFGVNPAHPPTAGSDPLHPGVNHVLVRVRGGQYAGGGFFARVRREPLQQSGDPLPSRLSRPARETEKKDS